MEYIPDVITSHLGKYRHNLLVRELDSSKCLSMKDRFAKMEHHLADGMCLTSVEGLPLWRAVEYGETVIGKNPMLRNPIICAPVARSRGSCNGNCIGKLL